MANNPGCIVAVTGFGLKESPSRKDHRMHVDDLVVVARQHRYNAQLTPRRRRSRNPQWTLHRADCQYVAKRPNVKTLPAPVKPYPGTVACTVCKPPAPYGGS